jgi:hypothetical protein
VAAASDQSEEHSAETLSNQVLLQSSKENAAMQRDTKKELDKPKQLSRRVHGSALPE